MLCYTSTWGKGLDQLLKLFDKLLEVDNNFILNLASPGYESLSKNQNYIIQLKNKYGNNILIHGVSNKKILSKLIGESLCLIGPKFEETFGCVYQEAYYLNTPVISDKSCGGCEEIIDNASFIDYNNSNEFIDKILFIKNNYENIQIGLNPLFYEDYILKLWDNILFNV
jgi:glycosyltransferase involved in cell wall biosynthesis